MFNLKTVLKAFDVKVSDEHIAAVERIIPLIPAKCNEVIDFVASNVKQFHTLLKCHADVLEKIEQRLAALEETKNGTGNHSKNGSGNGIATHTTNGGSE